MSAPLRDWQASSYQRTVLAGDVNARVADFAGGLKDKRWWTFRSVSAPVLLRVTETLERTTVVTDYALGTGQACDVYTVGAVLVEATGQGADATLHVTRLDDYTAMYRSPMDAEVTGLVRGGVGVPGPWTDIGPYSGFAPPWRWNVQLYTDTALGLAVAEALQFRLVDRAGTQRATFSIAGTGLAAASPNPSILVPLFHPPRYRLQCRHPGDDASTRGVLATWQR